MSKIIIYVYGQPPLLEITLNGVKMSEKLRNDLALEGKVTLDDVNIDLVEE